MSVRIRLQRHGKKKKPFYRIVAADQRAPRDGRFNELLGTYDPNQDPIIFSIKDDRYAYWLSVGAQPTDTVASLIRRYKAGKTVSPEDTVKANKESLIERRRAAASRAAAKEVKAETQEAPAEAAPAEAAAPAEEAAAPAEAEAAPAEAAAPAEEAAAPAEAEAAPAEAAPAEAAAPAEEAAAPAEAEAAPAEEEKAE